MSWDLDLHQKHCTLPDCSWCGNRGKNYVLRENEIVETDRRPKRPNPLTVDESIGYSALEIHDEPNRFDPFEALDSIQAAGLEFHDTVKLEKPFKLITVQVLALRAYITGMER